MSRLSLVMSDGGQSCLEILGFRSDSTEVDTLRSCQMMNDERSAEGQYQTAGRPQAMTGIENQQVNMKANR